MSMLILLMTARNGRHRFPTSRFGLSLCILGLHQMENFMLWPSITWLKEELNEDISAHKLSHFRVALGGYP